VLLGVRILANGSQHARVGEAAAENAAERGSDFFVRGLGISVEDRLGGQDDAAEAKAALSGALVDEGFLKRMRPFGCAQSIKGCDFG
jgi:hypothetical protein